MEAGFSESAVWQRVTAAGREQGGQSGTGPVGPELLSALEREMETGQMYRRLALGSSGEVQRTLLSLGRQSGKQGRDLGALYYFLTGERPALAQEKQGRKEKERLEAGLRKLMQREELSAGRLEALAGRTTGEAQQTLRTLALGTRKRFAALLGLLGTSI